MTLGSEEQLIAYLTSYDNSGEPKPSWNYPSTIYGVTITFLVLATACTFLRFWVRIKGGFFGWDDAQLVVCRLSASIYSIGLCLAVESGFGDHFLQADMIGFQKKFYAALIGYAISTTFIKLCLLSQYLRIFEAGSRVRTIAHIAIVFVALWGFAFSFIIIFPCFPVRGFFDWSIDATCYGFGSKDSARLCGAFVAHAATNSCLDIFVLALPSPLYFKRDKPWKQRLGIYGLILLGTAVAVVSIWRLYAIIEHQAATWPVMDPTWYGPKAILLAVVEVDLATMTASVPVFWPLLQEGFGRIFVTQEVEVTHQRLSGDDDKGRSSRFGDHVSAVESHEMMSSDETLSGSLSLNMVRTPDKAMTAQSAEVVPTPLSRTGHYPDFGGPDPTPGKPQGFGFGEDGPVEAKSEFQVVSEGPKGFRREQERMGYAQPSAKPYAHFFDKRSSSRQRSDSEQALRRDSGERLGSMSSRTFFYDSERDEDATPGAVGYHRRGPSQSSGGSKAWPSNALGGYHRNNHSNSSNQIPRPSSQLAFGRDKELPRDPPTYR